MGMLLGIVILVVVGHTILEAIPPWLRLLAVLAIIGSAI